MISFGKTTKHLTKLKKTKKINLYMKRIIYLSFLLFFPIICFAQKITYSEIQKGDSRDMSFDIIGKIKENQ